MASAADPYTCYLAAQLSIAVYFEPGHGEYKEFEVFAYQGLGEARRSHVPREVEEEEEGFHKCQWVAAYPKVGDSKDTLYVAFKGTSDAIDVLLDISFMDIRTKRGVRVHSGVYAGVQDELGSLYEVLLKAKGWLQTKRVIFTGHSLGGAYACLTLLELMSPGVGGGDDVPGEWPEGVHGEAITFGSPVYLRTESRGKGVKLSGKAAGARMTHFVLNYDIVPRLFVVRNSALSAMIDEAPKMAGGIIAQQIANIALKQSGLNSLKISSTFDNLRRGYIPTGTFIFMELADNTPGGTTLSGHVSVVHSETAKLENPAAKAALQYLPSIDPTCPCLRSLKDERLSVVSKALEDHSAYRYLNGMKCLLTNPISYGKNIITAKRRLPTALNPPEKISMGQPPSSAMAMSKRNASTPWCLQSRHKNKILNLHVLSRGVEVWKASVPPMSTVVFQGVKQPGDVVRVTEKDTILAEVVLPAKNTSYGQSHLALEYSGVFGYIIYESVTDEGQEIDIRCLYPKDMEAWRLHVHKLAYFTGGMGEGEWSLTDGFGAGSCEDRWRDDEDAPTCRGCLVQTFFGSKGKRKFCHQCGLAHCAACLPHTTFSLYAFTNKPAPICKKCFDRTSSQLSEYHKSSMVARSYLSLLILVRAKRRFVTPAILDLIVPFVVKDTVEQSVIKTKKKFKFDW
eukprot:TRINITY_DN19070_c0_g1_i1.p1 TRINITY_DN19070_c0_g1~~TRINITY_DN19070_c0_g1_i1.p1  ORF type:complete len:681 (+),score=54.71 TRINITY_DN19070_c0_g1_i1:90-2132(+)